MDKESLKKNQFWYLLGGFALVWLILWVCALVSASSDANKNRDDLEKLKKTVADQSAKKPKNDRFIKPWNDYRDEFAKQKDSVWGTAWEAQQTFYVWPEALGRDFDFNKLMLYAADTKDLPMRVREAYQQEIYKKQFEGLKESVTPAIFGEQDAEFASIMGPTMGSASTGNGPQGGGPPFRGGDPGRGNEMPGASTSGSGMTYLSVLNLKERTDITAPPTPEEIWILQEDFWVKHEMLNILHNVQQSVARFQHVEVKADEPKPEGVQKDAIVQRFSNGLWEFTFYIERSPDSGRNVLSPKSTIKNVSPTHAVQIVAEARGTKPLEFLLTQKEFPPYTLQVGDTPLAFNETHELSYLKKQTVDNLDVSKPFELEQKFDWSNAPIRRIDALVTAKQSHRTAICALEPNPIFKVTDTPGSSPGAPTAPGPGGPTGGSAMPGPGGPGGGFGALANSDTTPYGLERDRYIMATPQARHLPIAMDLVVEPAHINDVLVAIANSPLRIQTTQIAFQKLARVPPPPEPEDKAVNPNDPPMRPRNPMGLPGKGGLREGGPSGKGGLREGGPRGTMPPRTTGPTGTQTTTIDDNDDTNLVELTVYGIATLYERPKPKDAAPAPPGNPQTNPMPPTTPMPKTTPMPGKS